MKKNRNPDTIHSPFSTYSHQIEIINENRLLALSGQIGVDRSGKLAEGVSDQLKLAWHNVGENLLVANMTYENIVKLTIYFVNDSIDTDDRRRLFKELFGSILPCMTVLYVSALGDSDMKVELDVWASAEGPGR